jgi:hypothetical protein
LQLIQLAAQFHEPSTIESRGSFVALFGAQPPLMPFNFDLETVNLPDRVQ